MDKDTPSAKVMRWRLAVQDYSFDIAYIPGAENVMADGLSRMCPRQAPQEVNIKDAIARESINSLIEMSDSQELLEWKTADENIGDETATYWLETQEDISSFHAITTQKMAKARKTSIDEKKEKEYFIDTHIHKLLRKCHNSEIGHFGVNPTLEIVERVLEKDPSILKDKPEWKTKRKDVTTFIKRCELCEKMRTQRLTQHTKHYAISKYGVLENIAIDSIHISESKAGNTHMLTIIDLATRYTVLKPIKDLTAKNAAKAIMEYIYVYGIPNTICSDNGSQFQSVFEETIAILKAEDYKIKAYSHQENGIVERAHREIRRHLRALLHETKGKEQWDDHYLKIQAILNEKTSEATGLKPNEIIFAGKVDLHAGRLYPRPTEKAWKSMSEFMQEQILMQEKLIQQMEDRIEDRNEKRTKDSTEIPALAVGTYILAMHEDEKRSKMDLPWHGPYRITKVETRPQGTIYTVYDPKKDKSYHYHAAYVKPVECKDDLEASIRSSHDDSTYIVQGIIGHKVDENAKTLDFQVKLFGDLIPKWVKYTTAMKDNPIVMKYISEKNLTKVIPMTKRKAEEISSENEQEITSKKVRFVLDTGKLEI